MKNTNLNKAKKAKNDEFYTQYSDIEKELQHYKSFFKEKVVYCNCDDARKSNFFKYFYDNFDTLRLKKLICTGYNINGNGILCIYKGDKNINITELEGNGDFKSDECIKYLKQADIIVTNPPFSLFREFITQLMAFKKQFIILGALNAITYRETFRYIKDNDLFLGINTVKEFVQPNEEIKQIPTVWYTNIVNYHKNNEIELDRVYNENDYPEYDYYRAIEIKRVKDIPKNYDGIMGVPITYLLIHSPNQFEIIGITENADYLKEVYKPNQLKYDRAYLQGKRLYPRILIKKNNLTN